MTSLSISLVRSILATILVTAGIAKIIVPEETAEQKNQRNKWEQYYEIISKSALPVFEIVIAVLLLIPFTSKLASIASTLLFGIFLAMTSYNLSQKKETSCGCFGQLSKYPASWKTVFRTTSFLVTSTFLAFMSLELVQLDSMLSTFSIWIALLFAIIGTILVLNEVMPKIRLRSGVSTQSNLRSRREILKGLGAIGASILAFGIHREQATASGCCHCQYYDHFEPGCCDPYSEKKTRHYFRRCCNTCTGANGYWRKYQPDGCVYACVCYQVCDVLYSCTGGSCHCNDCGCCV